MIDFPASPTVGQQFTAAGVTWVWDGVKWAASGLSVAYVPLAGFVPAMNDNRIINGDMRIDQRNNGASGSGTTVYTVDRWLYAGSQNTKFFWGRNLGSPVLPAGFPYCLGLSTQAAYTLLASDFFNIQQPVEADAVSDFAWGTAGAQPVTLSFWAAASAAGTYSGSIRNGGGTRSYPFSFALTTAWTRVVIAIPGDTSGTWTLSGNGAGLTVNFDLGAGANWRAPAGAWASGNYVGANGAASLVTALGQLYFTGVKLEIGSVATPYNRQSLAKSMADCQRYYQGNSYFNYSGYSGAGSFPISVSQKFATTMRSAPTITVTPEGSTGITSAVVTANSAVDYYIGGTATGNFVYYGTFNASTEL
jgi:hypothetical protein